MKVKVSSPAVLILDAEAQGFLTTADWGHYNRFNTCLHLHKILLSLRSECEKYLDIGKE